ncbi:MAG: M23 family metallopeptidase [Desulfovibrio sp.]|jgi:murein DD-endopeptidase MepM/ murein hydrolase activator NlpD|nr:M23 family metallopeptidase [Desulfovibrio sp.]
MEYATYAGVALGILLLFVVCYFQFIAPSGVVDDAAVEESLSSDSLSGDADPFFMHVPEEEALSEEDSGLIQGVVAPGDTAGVLLQSWLSTSETHAMVEASKDVYALSRIRAGQPYTVRLQDEALARFEYEIDKDKRLVITRQVEDATTRWQAVVEAIVYDIQLVRVEGNIDSSLFEAMAIMGEGPALAVRLAEVFAWEINFIRDIQPGDSFRLLVEKRYREGEFNGYGLMPVAEFVNKKSKFEAYVFKDSFGNNTYFNAAGDNLKRAFLKAPLAFTRISSRFNLHRMHPILKTVRAHPAVDYAAPTGTPVKAIGSGVVTFRGYGKGAGNYITLKHASGYESMYLHLNGFAKGLKKGAKVRQGEVIGFVGSTGYSTGPHLDFRMKKNGQFLNPEKVLSPRDESVPKKDLSAFKAEREIWRGYLDGETALGDYGREEEAASQ